MKIEEKSAREELNYCYICGKKFTFGDRLFMNNILHTFAGNAHKSCFKK